PPGRQHELARRATHASQDQATQLNGLETTIDEFDLEQRRTCGGDFAETKRLRDNKVVREVGLPGSSAEAAAAGPTLRLSTVQVGRSFRQRGARTRWRYRPRLVDAIANGVHEAAGVAAQVH